MGLADRIARRPAQAAGSTRNGAVEAASRSSKSTSVSYKLTDTIGSARVTATQVPGTTAAPLPFGRAFE